VGEKENWTFVISYRVWRAVSALSADAAQEALATELGVNTNTISRWEMGIYEPTLDDLERLSRVLGVSILEFFPKTSQTDDRTRHVDVLLRTAQGLDERDLVELRRYAEFGRASSVYTKKTAGRKRK
jgi:transcriptional regulator with XRE-family HTH domain